MGHVILGREPMGCRFRGHGGPTVRNARTRMRSSEAAIRFES